MSDDEPSADRIRDDIARFLVKTNKQRKDRGKEMLKVSGLVERAKSKKKTLKEQVPELRDNPKVTKGKVKNAMKTIKKVACCTFLKTYEETGEVKREAYKLLDESLEELWRDDPDLGHVYFAPESEAPMPPMQTVATDDTTSSSNTEPAPPSNVVSTNKRQRQQDEGENDYKRRATEPPATVGVIHAELSTELSAKLSNLQTQIESIADRVQFTTMEDDIIRDPRTRALVKKIQENLKSPDIPEMLYQLSTVLSPDLFPILPKIMKGEEYKCIMVTICAAVPADGYAGIIFSFGLYRVFCPGKGPGDKIKVRVPACVLKRKMQQPQIVNNYYNTTIKKVLVNNMKGDNSTFINQGDSGRVKYTEKH